MTENRLPSAPASRAGAQGSTSIELTAAQRGIWYAQQLDPENPSYQIGQYLDLRGPIDQRLLRIALTKTVADLDAMSLRIVDHGAGPHGVIRRPSPTTDLLEVVDLRHRGPADASAVARERMDAELATPRDIVEGDLFATVLFRIADERWLLFQRVHHVLLDGYSAVIGLRYLAGTYSRLVKRAPQGVLGAVLSAPISHLAARTASPLPSLAALHAHLDGYRGSEQYAADAEYWRGQLAEDAQVTGLEGTTDRVARRVERTSVPIPVADAARLRSLGRDMSKTAVGLVALYLSKMTGQQRVSLGLPVTARRGPVAKRTPSMLSSILPLRVDVASGRSLAEVIASAGEAVRGAVAHQQYPVGDLAPGLGHSGPSVNLLPVIDDLTFGRARGTVTILSTGPVRDLSVVISGLTGDAAEPTLQLEGDAELYSARALTEHAGRLLELLTQVLDEPASTAVTDAAVVGADEAARLLARGAGAEIPIGQESVLTAFADIAAVRGAAPAVLAADGTLSFSEVEDLSSRLAHTLVERGVDAGSKVAVRIERSKYLPVLVLAALKSGGAYVPLDPEYPIDRVGTMIDDAAPDLLLTSPSQAQSDRASGASWTVPTLHVDDAAAAEWAASPDRSERLPIPPATDLAYVVFTSGSTGRPKGVGVERRALRNLFEHHRAEMFDPAQVRLGRPARVAHTAGLSFDAAWDPLLWLFAGHELHIVDDDVRRDPQRLTTYVAEREIDSIETTPSFAEALIAAGLFTQRRYPTEIALGGEAVSPGLWNSLAARRDVHAVNLYGPTETTVDSLIAPIAEGRDPHLGTSVRNTRHYLLDASLAPVPDGAIGELYLAGANVAAGYIGQPGLSAERFLADPFTADGTRMYRTGDLVRRRRNGSLRFLGRIDEQVKIRGYRVELSEVEAALRRCDGVTGAAAVVQGSGATARIVGYVTGDDDLGGLGARARSALASELPVYMVPGSVLALAELPMTPNGKLDRRALPDPSAIAEDRAQQPRTEEERIVVGALAEVLGLPSIGVDEDFFAAGGHSLLATQVAAQLSERLERQITVRDVFERPTAARLAETSAAAEAAHPLVPVAHGAQLPVSPAQRRLWFLNSLDPASSAYNIPIVLHLDGALDVGALRAALRDVVERHEPLRTVFPYVDGEPQQHILDMDSGGPTLVTVSAPADRLDAIVRDESLRPFDVTTEVPLRAVLLRTAPTRFTLVVTMHHIIADGWSLAPFAADLSLAYRAHAAGGDALPALPISYADYTLWQREALGSPDDPESAISARLNHWRRALADAPDEIELPRDRQRGSVPSDIGHLAFELDAARHAQLRAAAREHRTSLFILLHAAVAAALGQHGAGTDIVIGTPVAGRSAPELTDLIGFFVNTVPLRTSLSGDPTLDELVERVRASNTEAYAHQDVPFDAIVDALRPPRVADRHPVFQVLLTLQNTAPAQLDLGEVEVTVPAQVTSAGVKTDLMLDFSAPEGDDGALHAALAFDRALFDERTIAALRGSVDRMLRALVEHSGRRLSDVPALDEEALERLTQQSLGATHPVAGTVLDALEASAGSQPDHPALVDDAGSLTFAELRIRIEAMARALLLSDVQRGDRVAIALPRSADAIVAVLAAQRSGATAVPVDVDHPDARIAQILDVAEPALLIGTDAERLGVVAEAVGTSVVDPAT
ncbi:MAG: amino acid adenylation domain-containing protein, partial [Microbacterium sp.]